MHCRNWLAGIAAFFVLLLLTAAFHTRAADGDAPTKAAENASQADATAAIGGRASCSARGCHAGLEPVAGGGVRQDEYAVYLAHDKHALAFEVLKSERAQRMAENLAPTNPGGKPILASADARCLACHVTPQLAATNLPAEQVALREEGVSCEACHGGAVGEGRWLKEHTTKAWKEYANAKKAGYGLTPLDDVGVQARTCAGCHVGAPPEAGIPARDLNHDLMAAGHPRLMFDFGTFRANMPAHWRTSKYPAAREAEVWAVGQLASAKASLDVLAHRASGAAKGQNPWPEFAEASCFACHADLQHPSWRRNADYYEKRSPGAIPYNQWYATLLPALDAAAASGYVKLAESMNKPKPPEKDVAAQAAALAQALAAVKPRVDAKALAQALLARLEAMKAPSWDDLTQVALAAAALREATGKKSEPLNAVLTALAFPEKFESPHDYRPGELRGRLQAVLQDLAR